MCTLVPSPFLNFGTGNYRACPWGRNSGTHFGKVIVNVFWEASRERIWERNSGTFWDAIREGILGMHYGTIRELNLGTQFPIPGAQKTTCPESLKYLHFREIDCFRVEIKRSKTSSDRNNFRT